jgi:hypothetical protein
MPHVATPASNPTVDDLGATFTWKGAGDPPIAVPAAVDRLGLGSQHIPGAAS